jgi:CheY-like chemotaxis protein
MSAVILVVDDDDSYAVILPRLLQKEQLEVSLRFAGDGEQAIQYLRGEGRFLDRDRYPFPSLVLLDLKMPRINGFEVLQWKGRRPEFDQLPIVVWSSSQLPEDMRKAKSLGAVSYIFKPSSLAGLSEIIRGLQPLLENKNGASIPA